MLSGAFCQRDGIGKETMDNLARIVTENQQWLMNRVLKYAGERGYTKHTSTLAEASRATVGGLSSALLDALKTCPEPPEHGPDDDYKEDLIASFAILEARRHQERGVSVEMFCGLLKYYRQSYVDLVHHAEMDPKQTDRCVRFVDRFFERIKLGLCADWVTCGPDGL